jgi:hypothetical protein
MSDIERRAKSFLQWLEQRIQQREYTLGRIGYGRNRDLLQTEIAEAKQIRDRFLSQMQGSMPGDKPTVFSPKVVPIRRQPNAGTQAETKPADTAAGFDAGTNPPILH